MRCVVVIPVGPGHEPESLQAMESVRLAWQTGPGPFTDHAVVRVMDTFGDLGRSRARNLGMHHNPADFHFLLDADDRMMPEAFALVDLEAPATFGAIWCDGERARGDRHPVTRATLFEHGARGTLAMGCFLRGDLGLRFDETLDNGEDFDFYMRLPGFTKRTEPLVDISYRAKRDRRRAGWLEACEAVADRYRSLPT